MTDLIYYTVMSAIHLRFNQDSVLMRNQQNGVFGKNYQIEDGNFKRNCQLLLNIAFADIILLGR